MGRIDDQPESNEQQHPQKGQPQSYPPQQGQPQAYPPQQQQQIYPPQQVYISHIQAPQQTYAPNPGFPMVQQVGIGTPNTGFPVAPQLASEVWKSGLFDCFADPQNAIITACFPCVTFGQIAEILDNGATSCGTSGILYGCIAFLIGCPCIISCGYRSKLRARYQLVESPAPDWLTHCFCEWCALCQEYRELKSRDLDPAIGWQGNMVRQQQIQMQRQQVSMMPPTNQAMNMG